MAAARVEQEPRFVLELTEAETRAVLDVLRETSIGGTYYVYAALLEAWESQA